MKTLFLSRDKTGVFRPGSKIDDITNIKPACIIGETVCVICQHEPNTVTPISDASWLATLHIFCVIIFRVTSENFLFII